MGSIHSYTTTAGRRYTNQLSQAQRAAGHCARLPHEARRGDSASPKSRSRRAAASSSTPRTRGPHSDPGGGVARVASRGSQAVDVPHRRLRLADPRAAEMGAASVGGSAIPRCRLDRRAGQDAQSTTVRRAHEVLAGILDVAVRDRRIPTNLARGIKLPRKVAKSRAYLTHEQVALLAVESKNPELVVFLAYTGLRWGEATGLRVKHVDLGRRRVNVEENAVEVGSRIKIGTPKTHESGQFSYPALLDAAMGRLSPAKSRSNSCSATGSRMCVDRSRRPAGSTVQ